MTEWDDFIKQRRDDVEREIRNYRKSKEEEIENMIKAHKYIEDFRQTNEWKEGYFWFDREEIPVSAMTGVVFEFYKDVEFFASLNHPDFKDKKVEEYERKAEEYSEKGWMVVRVKFKVKVV